MKGIATNVMTQGKRKLKQQLNEDIYEANFIDDEFWRNFYLKISSYSAYLFNFALLHLATTSNLKQVDPIQYYLNSQHQNKLIVIAVLTFICSHGSQQANKDSELGYPIKIQPTTKMIVELVCDAIRIADYYLVYMLLNQEVFDKTENQQMQITGFSLFGMYVLFILRKFIFWLNILLVQKVDKTRWEAHEIIDDKVGEIGTSDSFRQLKTIVDNVSLLNDTINTIKNSHPKEAQKSINETQLNEEFEKSGQQKHKKPKQNNKKQKNKAE